MLAQNAPVLSRTPSFSNENSLQFNKKKLNLFNTERRSSSSSMLTKTEEIAEADIEETPKKVQPMTPPIMRKLPSIIHEIAVDSPVNELASSEIK